MKQRKMSDKQFHALYEHHLPNLYRAALCLTGNQRAAEKAAGEAWLKTALNRDFASDDRLFMVQSARLLYKLCEKACRHSLFDPWEILNGDYNLRSQALAEGLLGLEYEDRAMVIFSVLCGCGAAGTAKILRRPLWSVRWRLRYLGSLLEFDRMPEFENWRVCA